MFDLRSCHQYWFEYNDPNLYKALVTLESVEKWTVESKEEIKVAVSKLEKAMTSLKDKKSFTNYPLFVAATNPLKSSQIMRILQELNICHPDTAHKVIAHAEGDTSVVENHIFVERNIAFERLRLMGRIFSEQRVQKVLELMENDL